jgi:hypothetical protein
MRLQVCVPTRLPSLGSPSSGAREGRRWNKLCQTVQGESPDPHAAGCQYTQGMSSVCSLKNTLPTRYICMPGGGGWWWWWWWWWWWHTPFAFNPSTQEAEAGEAEAGEAEAGGFQPQPGLQSEFQDSQDYTEKPCLEKKQNKHPPPKDTFVQPFFLRWGPICFIQM